MGNNLYLALALFFQVVFLLVSVLFVVAFYFSAADARNARTVEGITERSNRFLEAVQSVASSVALFFFFWAFNIGSGLGLAATNLSTWARIAFLVFMMGFWIACAIRLAWAWNQLQRAIRDTPKQGESMAVEDKLE